MNGVKLAILSTAIILSTGCSTVTTRNIDAHNAKEVVVKGLSYKDFQRASNEAIDSMLRSKMISKPGGGRYVLVISDIINDTMQRIDIDQLIKGIRIDLLNSGKVVVTTAVSAKGKSVEDKMSMDVRELRGHSEFNQKTAAGKNQLILPDLSLSGKIIQRNNRINRYEELITYYFQLSLTDLNTGLAHWEGQTVIQKAGSGDSVSW
jgi:uncharacterized protein (TIGR02722 family)